MDKDQLVNSIRQIMSSPAWGEVEKMWGVQREAIIHRGKILREKEDKVQMWAELDGFDKARSIIYKMAECGKSQIDSVEIE